MLIQYVNELSTVRPLFFCAAIQIANFIQMKGTGVCRLCFRGLFAFVRFVHCYLFRTLQRVRFLPSFAVIVCAWVRLCALARCLRLFLFRLRGFYCFCNTLSTLHAFARLCGLYCIAASFVLPPFGDSTTRRGKGGGKQGESPPASVVRFITFASLPRLAAVSLK